MSKSTVRVGVVGLALFCVALLAVPSTVVAQSSNDKRGWDGAGYAGGEEREKEEADDQEDDENEPETGVIVGDNHDGEGPNWRLEIDGYLRTMFTAIANDPNVDFVGRHDGFRMADARLELNGELDNGIGFQFELDGAVEQDNGTLNSPRVDLVARLKDAYIYYQPLVPVRVSAGQFKPPFDIEELTSNSELLFVRESVGSAGVDGVAGFNVDGLSLDRQAGVRVDGEPWYFLENTDEPSGPGVSYALAVTNGSSAFQNVNDNDRFAYYGRANFHWEDHVRVGGAYYYNDKTRGERPNRYDDEVTGWTADATVELAGLTAIGSIIQRKRTPFDGQHEEGAVTSRAYQGQIAYEEPFLGLQPAYRYAFYDPSYAYESELGEGGFDNDALTYHTIGLNYNAQNYPVRLMLNYTITGEQEGSELNNNRFDALLQLTW